MTSRRVPAARRTSARILDGARVLFNHDGSSSVSTNHIAAHVGISPGNLYYWYPDKAAIIRALWAVFAAERNSLWEPAEGALPGPDDLIDHIATGTARLSERYAFLVREEQALMHADAELRARYVADATRRLGLLTTVVRSWWIDGLLTTADGAEPADLARALWALTEGWLLPADPTGPRVVADGRRLLRAVLGPYLRPSVPSEGTSADRGGSG